MTSYQKNIHRTTNFKVMDEKNKGTFGAPFGSRKNTKVVKKPPPMQKGKLYSATGTAPAPCKDFFELVVHKDEVIFRKWRIRYTKNGKVIPSEDRMHIERFLDNDVIQNEIERNLGDDVLHLAIGHLTNNWLPRLPIQILGLITSYMSLGDICRLQKVCTVFNKRLQNDVIWMHPLVRDFEFQPEATTTVKTKGRTPLRLIYKQELRKMKEAEIDWDNV